MRHRSSAFFLSEWGESRQFPRVLNWDNNNDDLKEKKKGFLDIGYQYDDIFQHSLPSQGFAKLVHKLLLQDVHLFKINLFGSSIIRSN